jgi:hypothetical protein
MRDEIDGRLWDAHGQQFSEDLHNLFVAAGAALARLHQLAWEAPWRWAATRHSLVGQA